MAGIINKIDNKNGPEYLNSRTNRNLELLISVPALLAGLTFIAGFGILKKIEDGGPMFFRQKRLGKTIKTSIDVVKIRCMHVDSDRHDQNKNITDGLLPEDDPRNTKVGKFMRKFQLEELPQLFQVILGQMRLIGIRSIPEYDYKDLKSKFGSNFDQNYNMAGGSLVDINTALKPDDRKQQSVQSLKLYDFYIKHASVGFDLYILWRTFIKLSKLSSHLKKLPNLSA